MQRPVLLAVALLLAPLALTAQQPSGAPHDSLRGAVRVVDARNRTLEVTTGVGLALRVVQLAVPPGVPVTDRGHTEPMSLGELKPGDVIRVSFGVRVGRDIAYSIERLGRMEAGGETAP